MFMSKYYSFSHEPRHEDVKLYEYLATKTENFKLYMYEKIDPRFEKFNIEKVYAYPSVFELDSPGFLSLFNEYIKKSNVLRFYTDNNSAQEISRSGNVIINKFNSDYKQCILKVDKFILKKFVDYLPQMNSISFINNAEVIANLAKLPDHNDFCFFDSVANPFSNKTNLFWEYMYYLISGKTSTLLHDSNLSIKHLMPFSEMETKTDPKNINYAYLSLYNKENREVLYFNAMSNYTKLCITQEELDELISKGFDTSSFYSLKTDISYDTELSPFSISDSFDPGFIDESFSNMIIDVVDDLWGEKK